eukprot:gene2677-2714_t
MGMAVAIFFVLSGFVIGHVTQQRETDARSYAISRAARIFSVALPAIVITVVLDAIGRSVTPGLYTSDWGFSADHPLLQMLTALTFTQKAFGLNFDIGSDLPYWSLNYEVAYYIVFGVFAYVAAGIWKYVAIAAILAASGPAVIAMFPLWIAGAVVARWKPWTQMSRNAGRLMLLTAILGFGVYEIWATASGRPAAQIGPAFRPELPQDYLVTLMFLLALTGLSAIPGDASFLLRAERPIRWLAGRTFSLYLYHLPVAQFLAAISPWPITSMDSRVVMFAGTFAIVLALAEVTEMRKPFWRRMFSALFRAPFSPRRSDPRQN